MGAGTKEKIMEAVLRLLQRRDIKSMPIRDIAKEAGVNSAAISYYFQGKAQLFQEVMRRYWAGMMRIYESILSDGEITVESAERYCLEILDFELASTGIVRSEQSMYIEYGMDEDTAQRIETQFAAMRHMILALAPQTEEEMMHPKIAAAIFALIGPAYWPEMTEAMVEDKEAMKRAFVRQIVRNIAG